MCGFSALVGGGQVTPEQIRAMTGLVRHRGPDDEGFALFGEGEPLLLGGRDTPEACYDAPHPYAPRRGRGDGAHGYAALGHRRLSIIDTSPAGHQPMSYDDGRLWLVYNGEIYNYLELRAELEAAGYAFQTHSDSEVILAAYHRWGSACLSRFNGMWAFAIVDRAARRMFVARDRWGIKPLYYWVSGSGLLAFGSEIKQFTALPGWRATLNGQRAYDFLNWRVTDHTAETLFRDVHQLRGGEFVEIDLEGVAAGRPLPFAPGATLPAQRWYQLRPAEFEGSFDDAAVRFRELLTDSVRLRLRADVPVGSCLSGGLDSSSIVCAMDDLLRTGSGGIQKTFSACSPDPRFDEREYIDEVVRSTAVEPHYVYPTLDGAFDELDRVTWHQDEPFASTSIYAQWQVFRLARANDVIVMLDGQGSDEQLAGYHTFFAPLFAGLLGSLRLAALMREMRAARRVHGYSGARATREIASILLPGALRAAAVRIGGRTQDAPGWLDVERMGAEPSNPFKERGAKTASVRDLSVAQLTSTNLQMLLHWEDRDSMAHSVESRIPFLDYRLVEFVLGLPTSYKIGEGVTKRVLREGMRPLLPERVRTRMDKMGFLTAEEAWVRHDAPDRFRGALRQAVADSRGVLRPSAGEKLDRIISGAEPFESFAWRLISFGAWARTFEVAV